MLITHFVQGKIDSELLLKGVRLSSLEATVLEGATADYKAAGIIHTIPVSTFLEYEKLLSERKLFTSDFDKLGKAVVVKKIRLIRNPVERVRSLMNLFTDTLEKELHLRSKPTYDYVLHVSEFARKLGLDPDSKEDISFAVGLLNLQDILEMAVSGIPIVRMEDITSDFSSMQKFFSFITDGKLSITEDMKKLYSRKIRKRSDAKSMSPKEIFLSWKEKWRKAFLDFISENKKMWSLYTKFYQLDFI